MEHKTLKYLRLILPGMIILVCLLPFIRYQEKFKSVLDLQNGILFGISLFIAILFGGFYHILNFRGYLWKQALVVIHKFLKDEMIKPFKSDLALYTKLSGIKDANKF